MYNAVHIYQCRVTKRGNERFNSGVLDVVNIKSHFRITLVKNVIYINSYNEDYVLPASIATGEFMEIKNHTLLPGHYMAVSSNFMNSSLQSRERTFLIH